MVNRFDVGALITFAEKTKIINKQQIPFSAKRG